MKNYLITALVTTYNSERFMRGLLEDLESQTIAEQLEIVVVDSNSPQNERAIIEEFQQRYDNIVYIRTDKRETSHASWNHCIHAARGKYLTIACTDDRHRPDAFELMVRVLDEYPEYGLVYADSLITNIENETFERNSATKRYDWPDYNLGTSLSSCIFGPQPVWRREVHDKAGYFDPELWIAGDHDLFIRIAWHCGAVHLRETLGLFLQRNDSNSGRDNSEDVIRDVSQVMRLYRKQIPITEVYPGLQAHADDPVVMAAVLWHFGNLCALNPYTDFEMAIKKYQAALAMPGMTSEFNKQINTMFSHNIGLILYCLGEKQQGKDFLSRALELPSAKSNLELMEQLEQSGKLAILTNFNMLQLEHAVIKQACRASGIRLDSNGALIQTAKHEQIFWDVYSGPNGIPVSEAEKAQAVARKPRQQDECESIAKDVKQKTRNFDIPASSKSTATKIDSQNKLHILMTMFGWADEGGGTIHPRQVAKTLVQRGHKVTVVYTAAQTKPDKPTYYVEESQEDGVQLFAIYNQAVLFIDLEHPEREIADPDMLRIMKNLIISIKPDIVNYASLLNFSAGILKDINRAGIPSIYTPYNYWPICPRMYLFRDDLTLCSGPSSDGSKCAVCIGKIDNAEKYGQRAVQIRRAFNNHINRHLAVSHRVRQIFVQNGYEADRIQVLHQPSATTDWIWQEVGKSRQPVISMPHPVKVGFIGSLLSQKGVHVLVKALQAFQPDQVEGHIFGAGPESYFKALRQMDSKGLVQFHGQYELSQLPHLLNQVDVIVIPSIWEDCAPFVVQEALAARCPVIGSRIGGIPEFIEKGVNGFIFNPCDSADLASVLFRFMSDSSLLGRMQNNIQPPKSFETYLDELLRNYREAITQHNYNASFNRNVRAANHNPTISVNQDKFIQGNKVLNHNFESLNIRWEGSQFVYHSLALINRELCLQLQEAGHTVSIIPYEPDEFDCEVDERFQKLSNCTNAGFSGPVDVHVRHQWPPNLTAPDEGHWIIIQPWEFGSLPKQWVEVFSTQVDEMWVPSNYLRQVYLESCVPAERVFVVPNGINPDKFHPEVRPYKLKTKKKFKFLFVGGTIHRKGIDLLLVAYINVFKKSDDVCLVIKDMGCDSFYQGMTFKEFIKKIKRRKNAPAIEYIDAIIPEEELTGLYTACDVLVHPYRGEGFGLPIIEAMACGTPAIVTNGGACLDFCNYENSLLVKAIKIQSAEKKVEYFDTMDFPWFYEVNLNDLKKHMCYAFQNPVLMKKLGGKATQDAHNHWTWKHATQIIQERIAVIKQSPIQRHTIKMGKEKKSQYFYPSHPASGTEARIHVVDKLFSSDEQQYDAMFREGSTLVKKGQLVDGLKVLSHLLELRPNHTNTLKLMGNLFQKFGKDSEAHEMWELALSQESNNQK